MAAAALSLPIQRVAATLWSFADGVLVMKYRTRTFYTEAQKSEMWDRWQRV